MSRFVQKPPEVDAVQFDGKQFREMPDWLAAGLSAGHIVITPQFNGFNIPANNNLGGTGDWIVRMQVPAPVNSTVLIISNADFQRFYKPIIE